MQNWPKTTLFCRSKLPFLPSPEPRCASPRGATRVIRAGLRPGEAGVWAVSRFKPQSWESPAGDLVGAEGLLGFAAGSESHSLHPPPLAHGALLSAWAGPVRLANISSLSEKSAYPDVSGAPRGSFCSENTLERGHPARRSRRYSRTNSTRRLRARPAAVLLDSLG